MDVSTQTHLTTLRGLLNYRRQELLAEVHAAELAQREASPVAAHEVADRKDEAAQRQLEDVGSAQEQRDRDELIEVEAALRRLDTGTFGDCCDCGEPISMKRLLVQPAAVRCAACQSAREHAHRRVDAS